MANGWPPRHGEWRTVRRFAWLPTVVEDGVLWLRHYSARQVYDDTGAEPWGPAFDWRTVERVREPDHQT